MSLVQIRGGAGPYEAAVIAAVVEQLLSEEAAAFGPGSRPVPASWVVAGRPIPPGKFAVPPRPERRGETAS